MIDLNRIRLRVSHSSVGRTTRNLLSNAVRIAEITVIEDHHVKTEHIYTKRKCDQPYFSSSDFIQNYSFQPDADYYYHSELKICARHDAINTTTRPCPVLDNAIFTGQPQKLQPGETTDQIIVPTECKMKMKSFTLPNNIAVMVIQDNDAQNSAAALNVNVGSLHNEGIDGLANLCRSMLFTGTEKYPDENEFDRFVTSRGGSHNAYTSHENTNYHFEIEAGHMNGALHRFAQFFMAPLLHEGSVERQINELHSIHQRHKYVDERRLARILNHALNATDHPLFNFDAGDLETLKVKPLKENINIREKLKEFHSKNYSANIMTLALTGPQSIEELEDMAKEFFTEIKNTNVQPKKKEEHNKDGLLAYEKLSGNLLKVVPYSDDVSSIVYIWRTPEYEHTWPTQFVPYIRHVLEHEGEGSLLSVIKEKGLGDGLNFFSEKKCGTHMFGIQISGTEVNKFQDDDQIRELTDLVMTTVNLLKRTPVDRRILKELEYLRKLEFNTKELDKGMPLVQYASKMLSERRPEVIFASNDLIWDTSPLSIKILEDMIQESFTNKNLGICFIAPGMSESVTEKEHFYGIEYSLNPIPKRELELIIKNSTETDKPEQYGLRICDRNPYVPTDLSPVGKVE